MQTGMAMKGMSEKKSDKLALGRINLTPKVEGWSSGKAIEDNQ